MPASLGRHYRRRAPRTKPVSGDLPGADRRLLAGADRTPSPHRGAP